MFINLNSNSSIQVLVLNEYITMFSEIKPYIDQLLESTFLEQVIISNDGCKLHLVNKIINYIKDHDVHITYDRLHNHNSIEYNKALNEVF